MPTPSREEIAEAGRRLQRGGLLGTGSRRLADRLVREAGEDGQNVGMDILDAANEHEPRRWAR